MGFLPLITLSLTFVSLNYHIVGTTVKSKYAYLQKQKYCISTQLLYTYVYYYNRTDHISSVIVTTD